jgi:thiol-disulfide isomerase/thioredoxin
MNYKKIMMYGGIALAVIVMVALAWQFFSGKKSTCAHMENFSIKDADSGDGYKLLFFYANWCPHCKAAKPEMEKVKADLDGKQINGQSVRLVEYDCTEPSSEMESVMDKYSITSYPTIILVSPNGSVTHFENKPTRDAVTNFLTANVK